MKDKKIYNIIIVEDDEITALNLNLSLQKHGYRVLAICNNTKEAKTKIEKYKPDIVLLDISLEDENDGIELAKCIGTQCNIPFIYLSSHSDDAIISKAKLTEPYGYIVKPFDSNSLHTTIQMAIFKFNVDKERQNNFNSDKIDNQSIEKLLHSKKDTNKPIIYFGEDYYFNIDACETYYKDKKIKLTKKENAFFRLLIAKLGVIVSFKQAMNHVWSEKGATENSIRTLVWRLRNKLETDIIKNASGIGYYIEK